ncbi:MAG: hypothetical protein WC635_03555 [Bacteriovorax sp.]
MNLKTQTFAITLFLSASNAFGQTGNIKKSGNNQVQAPCLVGTGNTNCRSLTSTVPSTPGIGRLSPGLQSVIMQIAQMGDHARTLTPATAATNANMKNIIAKKPMLDNHLKRLQQQSEFKARSRGLPVANYTQVEEGLFARYRAAVVNVLQRHKLSSSEYLKGIGGRTILTKVDQSSPKSDTSSATIRPSTAPIPVAGTVTGAVEGGEAVAYMPEEKSKVFKLGQADINSDKEGSIWTVISNRYLKSFIPHLDEIEQK